MKYIVEVQRISVDYFEVEAESSEKAKEKAIEEAKQVDWASEDAEYLAFLEHEDNTK